MKFLAGKKSYILATLAGIYAALVGLDVLPSLDWVWGLLGAGGVAAVRAGISKSEKSDS